MNLTYVTYSGLFTILTCAHGALYVFVVLLQDVSMTLEKKGTVQVLFLSWSKVS